MTKTMKSCRGQFCLHLRTSDDTYYVAGKFSLTRTVELEITFLVIALKVFDLFMFKCVFPLNTHFTARKVFHHRLKTKSMTEKVRLSVCTDNICIEHKNHGVFLCWSFRPMFFIIKKIIIGGVRKDETQAGWLNSYEASAFTLQCQWNVTTGGVIESVVYIQYIYGIIF